MKYGLGILLLCVLRAASPTAGVEDSFDYFVNNWNVIQRWDFPAVVERYQRQRNHA